jgi:hypothetical protein
MAEERAAAQNDPERFHEVRRCSTTEKVARRALRCVQHHAQRSALVSSQR